MTVISVLSDFFSERPIPVLGKTHQFLFSGPFSFSVPQPFLVFLLIHFCIRAYPDYDFGGLKSYLMEAMKCIFPTTALLNLRKTAGPQAAGQKRGPGGLPGVSVRTDVPTHSDGHRGQATRWSSPPAAPTDTETEELNANGNILSTGGTKFFVRTPEARPGNTAGRLTRCVVQHPANVKHVPDTVLTTLSALSHLTLSRASVSRFHSYPDV